MFGGVKSGMFAGSSSGSLQHIADAGGLGGSSSLDTPLVGHHTKTLSRSDHASQGTASTSSLHGVSMHGGCEEEEDDEGDKQYGKLDVTRLFLKLNWRILPLFWVMVILCYIDRTNLAFAAIQLSRDRGITPAVYGLGSGLFFTTYAGLQIPSNLVLRAVGGPTWLATIIALWGGCACAFAAMRTHTQFYLLRAALGVAEAGAFPGMWYVLSCFYPSERLTLAYAVVESGISLSHTIAGPLAAACLALDEVRGLAGWQWLFLLEGAPSLVLAVVMWLMLPASPSKAKFLTDAERAYLTHRIASQQAQGSTDDGSSGSGLGPPGSHGMGGSGGGGAAPSTREALRAALCNRGVWYMGCCKILHDIAGFGIIFFAPMMVQALLRGEALDLDAHNGAAAGHGHGHGETGVAAAVITSLPFGAAAAASFWVAHRSQREGERVLHTGVPYLVCGLAFTSFPLLAARSPVAGFVALTVGVIGVYTGSAPALSLVSDLAAGPGLVVALPLYNAVGNIGGFIGPTLIGYLLSTYRSFAAPTLLMGGSLAAAGALVLALPAGLRAKAVRGGGASARE